MRWASAHTSRRPSGRARACRASRRSPRPAAGPAPIIDHPDVKRMLLTMKSSTEACRALALYAALQLDIADHASGQKQRAAAQARADLLIPIVKGWCTETGNRDDRASASRCMAAWASSRRPGAAQYVRDVRITTIYEGTTGIQSNDLIGRKIGRDGGAAMSALIADMSRELQALGTGNPMAAASARRALEAVGLLKDSTAVPGQGHLAAPRYRRMAVSVPYLMLCGYVIGGWLMAKAAGIAADNLRVRTGSFYESKLHTARFYAEQVLPSSAWRWPEWCKSGAGSVVGDRRRADLTYVNETKWPSLILTAVPPTLTAVTAPLAISVSRWMMLGRPISKPLLDSPAQGSLLVP